MDKVTQAGVFPRLVTHDQARDAAKNFIDAHFRNKDGKGVLTGIPARPEHDDLVLTDYIKQQAAKKPYAPDRITPEAKQAAIDAYGAVTGEAPWEDGMEAALLAAFAVLGGAI